VTVEIVARARSRPTSEGIDHGGDFATVISQRPPRRIKSPADEITRSRARARARARGRNHSLMNGITDSMLQTPVARRYCGVDRHIIDRIRRATDFFLTFAAARRHSVANVPLRSGIMRHLARSSMMTSSIMLRGRLHGTPANHNSTQAEE